MSVVDFIVAKCALDAEMDDYLYVRPDFSLWQSTVQAKRIQSFGIFRKDNLRAYGRLTLAGKDGVWTAPVTGTFGGPVLARGKNIPLYALDALFLEATRWLEMEAGAKSCSIRLPPHCFPDPLSGANANALFRLGWKLDQVDVNYHLPAMSADDFHARLGATKRQETRRLKGSGAAFKVLPAQALQRVYEIISRNRAARGFPMTMSWESIAALTEAFPATIGLFGVERGLDLLAAAICLRVTSCYFYVFYWGEAPEFRREMPVLLLAEGLVAHCHENGIAVIDIGIATDRSTPNEGLIAFKTGLGFEASPKLTFRYDFLRRRE